MRAPAPRPGRSRRAPRAPWRWRTPRGSRRSVTQACDQVALSVDELDRCAQDLLRGGEHELRDVGHRDVDLPGRDQDDERHHADHQRERPAPHVRPPRRAGRAPGARGPGTRRCAAGRSSRGRGNGTSVTPATRPGRAVSDTTRSARKTASAIECVTSTIVHGRRVQTRCSSRFSVSRVQRVERGEGLVEQQHPRRLDEAAGDGGPLAHADRQLGRPAPLEATDAGELAQGPSPLDPLGPADSADPQGQGDVGLHGHPRQQVRLLEHDGQVPSAARSGRRPLQTDRPPMQTVSRGGGRQPGQDPQQRRLAAAGGADDGDHLVVLDRQVDRRQRLDRGRSVPEPLRHADQVDVGH